MRLRRAEFLAKQFEFPAICPNYKLSSEYKFRLHWLVEHCLAKRFDDARSDGLQIEDVKNSFSAVAARCLKLGADKYFSINFTRKINMSISLRKKYSS